MKTQWKVLAGLGGCLGVIVLLPAVLWSIPNEILFAESISWPEFCRRNKFHLAIPAEAQPVSWRSASFFLSAYSKATFRLPATRTPQAWLQRMANQTWLKGTSSPDGLEYRARKGYYVRYRPPGARWKAE